jgi:ABC-type phosphate transport system permease subunit
LLAASRAIGETMIVVLGAGAAARLSLNPFEAMTTVTAKIVSQLTGDADFASPVALVAFALGMTLFVMTLGFEHCRALHRAQIPGAVRLMTDATLSPDGAKAPEKTTTQPRSLYATDDLTKKRNASEKRFQAYGITAILIGLVFLVVMAYSIISEGIPAFTRTVLTVEFTVTQEQFDDAESQLFKTRAYEAVFTEAMSSQFQQKNIQVPFDIAAIERIVGKPGSTIREFYRANPDQLGQPVVFELAASSRVDGYMNGRLTRDNITDSRFLMKSDLDLVDVLVESGIIETVFNWPFITGADSGVDNPGGAGIGASVVGSFFMMLVVLFLSLPIGVAASIYLEEFAPQNRITDLIEVNISNLAAVPSIVFGILGSRSVHPVHALAAIGADCWRTGSDPDDAPDDHHLDARLSQGRAAKHPRCCAGCWGIKNAGRVPPRVAAGDAGHLDRNDHRPGPGAW